MDTFTWVLLAIFAAPVWLPLIVGLVCFWVMLPTWIRDWAVRR